MEYQWIEYYSIGVCLSVLNNPHRYHDNWALHLMAGCVQSWIKLTQDSREFYFQFCKVYCVLLHCLSLSFQSKKSQTTKKAVKAFSNK